MNPTFERDPDEEFSHTKPKALLVEAIVEEKSNKQ